MIQYKGGDGSTKEKAIIILCANNEIEGVDAEYVWLEEKFGEENVEWEMIDQVLLDEGDSQFDLLKVKLRNDEVKEVWFDITDFYGKEDDE